MKLIVILCWTLNFLTNSCFTSSMLFEFRQWGILSVSVLLLLFPGILGSVFSILSLIWFIIRPEASRSLKGFSVGASLMLMIYTLAVSVRWAVINDGWRTNTTVAITVTGFMSVVSLLLWSLVAALHLKSTSSSKNSDHFEIKTELFSLLTFLTPAKMKNRRFAIWLFCCIWSAVYLFAIAYEDYGDSLNGYYDEASLRSNSFLLLTPGISSIIINALSFFWILHRPESSLTQKGALAGSVLVLAVYFLLVFVYHIFRIYGLGEKLALVGSLASVFGYFTWFGVIVSGIRKNIDIETSPSDFQTL